MGIYPFAGYYSKDLILESVYASGNEVAFGFGILAALFTAVYSMKIIIKVKGMTTASFFSARS